MIIDKINEKIGYDEIVPDFYDQQIYSLNPVRSWFHTNRNFIIGLLVKANYTKGKRIVDLGCGDCNWNTSLLPVHGVDVNEGMLRFSYTKGRLASYEVGDFNRTSLESQDADIVVASEVLEHVAQIKDFFKEVKRILKPAGRFILSVPYDTRFSLFRPLFFLQCLLRGYILNNGYYKKRCGHIQHFSLRSLSHILNSNGFIVDNIFSMRRFSIFAVAKIAQAQSPNYQCEDLTILIPTLNEEKTIGGLLSDLVNTYLGARVIVSDDGSSDNTARIATNYFRKNVLFLDRSKEKTHGLTASILDGINLVQTPYFVVIDADLQHPIGKIYEIYNILKLNYDLAVASRIRVQNWRLNRKIISYVATLLGKITLWLKGKKNFSYDILSGFWASNTSFIHGLIRQHNNKFQQKGYKILFDFLKIIPKQTRIGEVFYEFQTRNAGESKIKIPVVIAYLKSLFI